MCCDSCILNAAEGAVVTLELAALSAITAVDASTTSISAFFLLKGTEQWAQRTPALQSKRNTMMEGATGKDSQKSHVPPDSKKI